MNGQGHPSTLVAAQPGNANAARSGVFSRTGRVLAPRAQELTEQLMTLPHVRPWDVLAAEEIGSLIAHIEAIDADLDARGRRDRRTLMEARMRMTRELRAWMREFLGTPKARAEWAAAMAQGASLADEIARRRGAA